MNDHLEKSASWKKKIVRLNFKQPLTDSDRMHLLQRFPSFFSKIIESDGLMVKWA
jgi:hypothetical protein